MTHEMTKEVVEGARCFTRDFYILSYGEEAQAKMIRAFEDYPGFAEGIKEGRDVVNVLEDIMENAFQSYAWNNKVDPYELFDAIQNSVGDWYHSRNS